MRTHRKFLPYLYLFLLSLVPFLLFVLLVDPTEKINLLGANVGVPLALFVLAFVALFFLFTFIFANRRRGLLATLFVNGIFILRFFGLRGGYQIIILLIILLLIEYLYSRRTS